jgi:pimeloyl-ACP methyl ester carboxylesterase
MSITAIFVPGIMGTELNLPSGEVVWPPKVSETILGYGRIAELQSPDLSATRIIRKVSCVDFYEPMLSLFRQLGFESGGPKQLIEHPYDWRRDLFDLADGLADKLDAVTAEEIIIVAHSMGGLISRLVLETDIYRTRHFFPKITKFIALATPHNGAPLALARVLGLDKALGISAADFKRLSENEDYPSGYQLLPAPGEDACWDTSAGGDLSPLDFYDPQVAVRLGMKPSLVARTKALHQALLAGAVPHHVRYFYFSGAGHKTATRVNVNGGQHQVVFTPDAGDGTVPMWSSLPRAEQKQVVINEHANVFRGLPFKRVFFRLLGGDAGPPKETLEALEAEAAALNPLYISLQKPIFDAGDPIEFVIASEALITDIEGRLVFDRLTNNDRVEVAAAETRELRYIGPGVYFFAMTLDVSLQPGFYELRYEGERPMAERVVFVVAR